MQRHDSPFVAELKAVVSGILVETDMAGGHVLRRHRGLTPTLESVLRHDYTKGDCHPDSGYGVAGCSEWYGRLSAGEVQFVGSLVLFDRAYEQFAVPFAFCARPNTSDPAGVSWYILIRYDDGVVRFDGHDETQLPAEHGLVEQLFTEMLLDAARHRDFGVFDWVGLVYFANVLAGLASSVAKTLAQSDDVASRQFTAQMLGLMGVHDETRAKILGKLVDDEDACVRRDASAAAYTLCAFPSSDESQLLRRRSIEVFRASSEQCPERAISGNWYLHLRRVNELVKADSTTHDVG